MIEESFIIKTHEDYPPHLLQDGEIYYPSIDLDAVPETDIHFKLIANLVLTLENFLGNRADTNVFSNVMFYYKRGSPKHSVSPDIAVCIGMNADPQRIYKLWEETVPSVILEIASGSSWQTDLYKKFELYEFLDVGEYYIFDPTYEFMPTPFFAFQLINKELVNRKIENGRVFSKSLGLEFVDTGETLRLFNPETNEFLMTMEEIQAENEKLKAELAKLK